MVDMALFSCEDMSDEECISFARKSTRVWWCICVDDQGKGGQLLVTKDGLCHKGQAKLIQAVDTMGAGGFFLCSIFGNVVESKDGPKTVSLQNL